MGSVEWDQSVLIGEGSVNEVWRIGYGGGELNCELVNSEIMLIRKRCILLAV